MSDGGELLEFLRRIFERRGEQQQKQTDRARDRRPSRIVAILGSARQDGNTAALTHAVFRNFNDARVINLNDHVITPYDYHNEPSADDFLEIVKQMVEAEAIVFASPVYWYSMSGQMKIFFDRLTDLTDQYKSIGRALAGKSAFLIATSNTAEAPPSFEPPFADTARYFDMRWGGMIHFPMREPTSTVETRTNLANAFARRIENNLAAPALAH